MSILNIILLSISLLTNHSITQQANMSVLVQNMTTGEIIDEHRADNVVPPASVMKLLTTGAALEMYGPNYRIPTTLEHSAPVNEGVLQGNLYIHGSCDPSLGWNGKIAFLYQWAKALRKKGIKKIDGSVVADMTMLDTEAQNPAWLCEDVGNYYAPGIFGINYYGNTMNIVLESGEPGTIAKVVRTEPQIEGLYFVNHVRCDKITHDGAFVSGIPFSRERYLSGAVPSRLGVFGIRGDLPNPGLLLAQHFTKVLREVGIIVTQEPSYEADYNPLTPPRQILYTHYSPTLAELIKETNINSNNLYAEALFRLLGTRYTLPGTIYNSQEVLRDYWRLKGVNIQNAIIKDGCGLAPQNAISARSLVQLLTIMSASKHAKQWMESLPISGQTGTLKTLCASTPLEGRIYAKSGTISGTKNFAGYIYLPNGEKWAFAILINSAPGKTKNIQNVIQQYLLHVYQKNK